MKVDYILVGFGLAGLAFASVLEKNDKSYIVIDDNDNLPSRVVGGMFNPIILKRFSPAWRAHEMWKEAFPFYKELENRFQKKYIKNLRIKRILQSVEEQNNWVVASDKTVLSEYMQTQIETKQIDAIHAPYGYGIINNVGRVDGEELLLDYKADLIKKGLFLQESFKYDTVRWKNNRIFYNDIETKKIVFSEGFYVWNNPFFNYLPMNTAKGEMLLIEIPNLSLDFTLKSGVFMVPVDKNLYIVGATYNWDEKTMSTSKSAQKEIENKLKKFLKVPYKIIGVKVGIRPTVKDRRPLIGKHPKYPKLAVLNGLGTRGIIIAPSLAKHLFNHLENEIPLPKEMDIKRFNS